MTCKLKMGSIRTSPLSRGFTIVELLIVIVVVGILAALVLNSFASAQSKARDTTRITDIENVAKAIEAYNAVNSSYPVTADPLGEGRSDSNCAIGTATTDWVPNVVPMYIAQLPQSPAPHRANNTEGCYQYASDGKQYVLSAWGAIESNTQPNRMYRRVGFREGWTNDVAYYCANGTSTAYWDGYYKFSYTKSNISTCNEN